MQNDRQKPLFRRCACESPAFARMNDLCASTHTRRAFLGGIAGAAAMLSLPSEVLADAADRPILFRNVRIFDGQAGKLIEGRGVLVSGGRIQSLVPASEAVADARVIDGGGRTLMPGLIDSHWHAMLAATPQLVAMSADLGYLYFLAAEEAGRTLMRGFTTVRDVGGPTFSLQRAINEKRIPGPRIYPAGAMISQTSGHGDFRMRYDIPRTAQSELSRAEAAGIASIADGEAEVLRRVREQLMLGASQIKIMVGGGVSSDFDPLDSVQYTPAEIRAAVQAAADWGTYVCSHVYTSDGIKRAIDNGVRCIEHGQLADEETVRKIAGSGTWWSIQPFLADEDSNPKSNPIQRQQQEEISVGTVRAFELGLKHKAKMVWGTDILFNPAATGTQGKQLAKLSRWFEPAEVLRMATGRSGELLALSGPRNPYPGALGVIRPGALADILVVDGDPLQDLTLLADPDKNLSVIMKDGRLHKDRLSA